MGRRKPKRLNFAQCMALMRKHDPQAKEDGFFALQEQAAHFLDELMAEFQAEQDHGLRCWLLELIGDAREPRALPLLAKELDNEDESLRDWAARGLRQLDTKEARRILYDAGLNA